MIANTILIDPIMSIHMNMNMVIICLEHYINNGSVIIYHINIDMLASTDHKQQNHGTDE